MLPKDFGLTSESILTYLYEFIWIRNAQASYIRGELVNGRVLHDPTFTHVTQGVWTAQSFDYSYRPVALELFPLYFFIAGTECKVAVRSGTWDWYIASDADIDLHTMVMTEDGNVVRTLRNHPCYRHYCDDRLIRRSKNSTDESGRKLPLRHSKDNTIMHMPDHYRVIRTDTVWEIPLLCGKAPILPKEDDSAETKGKYALYAMMLLRPWRSMITALADWIGPSSSNGALSHGGDVASSVWHALHAEYQRWSADLAVRAAPFLSKDNDLWRQPPFYLSLIHI